GKRLFSASELGDVKIWDVASSRLIATFPIFDAKDMRNFHALALSPDARTLAAPSHRGALQLHDVDPPHRQVQLGQPTSILGRGPHARAGPPPVPPPHA